MAKQAYRPWTEAELAHLRARFPHMRTADLAAEMGRTYGSVWDRARSLGLHKSAAFYADPVLSARITSAQGIAHQFKPGMVPWNKGKPGTTGHHENTKAHHFKHGSKPHTWQPVGSLRVIRDGVLEQKMNDNPGPSGVRWKPVHRLLWEATHGPVPHGHVVVFKPSMKTTVLQDITLDRLECISRRENMLRNTVHAKYPPELARLVQLRGALLRAIRAKEAAAQDTTDNPQPPTQGCSA